MCVSSRVHREAWRQDVKCCHVTTVSLDKMQQIWDLTTMGHEPTFSSYDHMCKNMDMEGDSVVIWVFVCITVHPIITLLAQKLLITHLSGKAPITGDCFVVKKFSTNHHHHHHHRHLLPPWIRSLDLFGIDALPLFPGASTISSSRRFVVEGVFWKSGVVHSFRMVDAVLIVFGFHIMYSRDLYFFSYDFASYFCQVLYILSHFLESASL